MRRPDAEHLGQAWRVHEMAAQFELLDVWRYPIRVDSRISFEAVLLFLQDTQSKMLSGRGAAARLFKLRQAMGRVFGWDDDSGPEPRSSFDPVYLDENEALFEVQNATVHALMHLGRVPLPIPETNSPMRDVSDPSVPAADATRDAVTGSWAPQMAVYVKPRGALGFFYMKAIGPFRHFVVYPAMMRAVARAWPGYASEKGWPIESGRPESR